MINQIINKVNSGTELTRSDLKYILQITDKKESELIFNKAHELKQKETGKKIFFRGLIEVSNICIKDCYYCGIRRSSKNVDRYFMKEEEILKAAEWAYKNGFGSIVLQSGEREDNFFIRFIENVLRKIKSLSNGELGITISLGEQKEEVYKRWFDAGAHRYLLRIETSNENLYKKLHPPDHDFNRRKDCLRVLKKLGYQVGTGVMIGLPFQTIDNLVEDLYFFKEFDVDMIGMGPYIVSKDTPLAEHFTDYEEKKESIYLLSLNMIAASRLFLKNVNIASTTALQALKHFGREMGIKAGANIIMPNLTDTKYRPGYQLYDNKPCLDETTEECKGCLTNRLLNFDEEVGFFEWGDSKHFKK